jgi:hypothetical protein
MGKKYRPACGSEGANFIDRWCYSCKRDEAFRNDDGDSCPIVANSFVFDVDDPRYPSEWTFNDEGRPICTAFEPVDAPDKRDENAAIGDLFTCR